MPAPTPHYAHSTFHRKRSNRSARVAPSDINMVLHGTTVATNMVIERKGAEVGMITTRGFRDILHMGRHKRPHNFSLQFDVPWQSKPLVKRRNRLVVDERLRPPTGEVEVPLASTRSRRPLRPSKSAGLNFGRNLFPVLVPQQRARGKGARHRQARDAGSLCLLLPRGRERFTRVRALRLDRDERLYRSDDRPLPRAPRRPTARAWR